MPPELFAPPGLNFCTQDQARYRVYHIGNKKELARQQPHIKIDVHPCPIVHMRLKDQIKTQSHVIHSMYNNTKLVNSKASL